MGLFHALSLSKMKVKLRVYGFILFAPPLALILVALVQQTGWLQRLENLTISFRFQIRSPWDPPADPRLLVVGIDEPSLDYYGAWPWPRNVEADFLKVIAKSGLNPRTIAFDLMFTDPFDRYGNLRTRDGLNVDTDLANAAGLLPSVITGAKWLAPKIDPVERQSAEKETREALQEAALTQPFRNFTGDIGKIEGSTTARLPIDPLRRESLFGFINSPPAPDGIRYDLPMVVRVGEALYPSFALLTLCQILHVDADKVTVHIGHDIVLRNSSGKIWTVPITEAGGMAINYRNSARFPNVSFKFLFTALAAFTEKGTPLPLQANIDRKALLIGQIAEGAVDLGPTPLEAQSPLIYTHLNVLNDILRGDYLRFVPEGWVTLGWLAICWISLFSLRQSTISAAVGLPAIVILVYLFITVAIFWIWSIEIAIAWPVLAYFGVQFVHGVRLWRAEARGRLELKTVFSRMLSMEVVDHVLSDPAALRLGGTTRAVTILFSDIRDYTKISENIGNEELVRQLNIYFEEMVACVTEYGGTFHKFIGDAIMAVWGDIASISRGPGEDACNAVRAALQMRRKLEELNQTRTAAGLLPLRIGIGLNFGEVLVGQIGAARRSEFTVIGDPVNIASRLEGMTKEFRIDLAIGESVHSLIGDAFLTRRLGWVQPKGKSRPMMIFEVLGERDRGDVAIWTEGDLCLYHEALDYFLARDFSSAAKSFSACLERHPDDHCVQRYLIAARQFTSTPPPTDWDGRVAMESK